MLLIEINQNQLHWRLHAHFIWKTLSSQSSPARRFNSLNSVLLIKQLET